jgi:hypothetical protein
MSKEEVSKLISKLLSSDANVIFTVHAEEQMLARNMSIDDVVNVLTATTRTVMNGEEKNGTWAYAVRTEKFSVVIGFSSDGDEIKIVTAWRNEK